MQKSSLTQAENYMIRRKRRRIWQKAVTVLACVVVFVTTYLLILPAITMEQTAYCGLEEHKHEESCYEWRLVCGFDDENEEAHIHGEECYKQEQLLICDQEETEPHVHDESCVQQEKILICGQEESEDEEEGHKHTEECYETAETYICGWTEEAQGHVHTDECYEYQSVLICGLSENQSVHTHTDECYEKVLVCGKEEHEHQLICFSDQTADVETTEDWENSVSDVELTGIWADDVIAVAESQIGYQESSRNYTVTEDGKIKGYTRYGAWYGSTYGDWCAMFVSFCLNYAGIPENAVPYEAGCERWIQLLSEPEWDLYRSAGEYTPEKGDLIFFDTDGDGASDHVGLVEELLAETELEPAKVKTIEGNLGNCVQESSYELDHVRILGYAALPENPESENGNLDEENQARVEKAIALIEALPSSEEIEAKLTALEEAGDMDAYDAWFAEIFLQARTAYAQYEDLGPELQELVTNREKLLELEWLWSAAPLSLMDTVTVYQINLYSQAETSLVWGGTVGEKLSSGMAFTYWDAIVVETNSSGELYVDKYVTEDVDKRNYKASTAGGFVLLLYNTPVNAAVGDQVTLNFNYQTSGYSSSGYGTVSFSAAPEPKPDKDNSSKLTIVPSADTRELIEVNLYDYNSRINELYNSDKKYPGFQQDRGSQDVGDTFSKWSSFNFGNNITEDLAAGISNVTHQDGDIDINAKTNDANSPISGAMLTTLGSDGQPALADGTSLGYLFSDSSYAQKKNTQSINGLFQYNDTTGAYTFNSRENHAQFRAGSDTFTLYGQIISSNFMMYPFGNFLPFNDIVKQSAQTSTIDRAYLQTIANSAQNKAGAQGAGGEYAVLSAQLKKFITLMDNKYGTGWVAADAMNEYFNAAGIPRTFSQDEELVQKLYSIDYDEATDFYFGMEMKMKFMQPKGGLTGKDGKQPMVFYFTGDDDVWVYVDGVLFLDLSGIHRHVGGQIDFVKGEVTYYDLDVSTGDVSTTPSKTVKFSELVSSGLNSKGTFEDYSSHSFHFYYMERGAGSGVCRMNFNFPLLRQNSISVKKELSVDEGSASDLLGNPDFRFQILREDRSTLFINADTEYMVLGEDGKQIGSGRTDENGVFTLKAGQTAVFGNIQENAGKYFVRELLDPDAFEQYGQITVNGSSQTTDYDVTVGSDTFKGVDSPIKDVSDGSTAFQFNNQVTLRKLGSLQVTKKLDAYSGARTASQFSFQVKLDGKLLPVGTTYTVGGETRTITEEGILTLAPDETAVVSGILAGTAFTVEELADSAAGYLVTYYVDHAAAEGSCASGTIQTESTVDIVVNNGEKGTSVEIPVTKRLEHPDGEEHCYKFRLEQVTDASGETPANPVVSKELEIAISSDSVTKAFAIDYPQSSVAETPVTFYYKITEEGNPEEQETEFDQAEYVAEVTVSKDSDGELLAEITAVWKDGEKLEAAEGAGFPEITFVNWIMQHELPDTGGPGTVSYTLGGLLLAIAAGLLLLYRYKKRRKGDVLPS